MDVKLPDGTIIKNVPEGTTQEELAARLSGQGEPFKRPVFPGWGPNPVPEYRGTNETIAERLSRLPPPRHPLASMAQGGIDTAGAVAQLVSRGATAMGLPPGSDYPFVASPEVVDAAIKRARGQAEGVFGDPNAQGVDLVRAGTSAALSAPYMGEVGSAPSLLGRAGQAARAGAVGGALQPTAPGLGGLDFVKQKGVQTGLGLMVGGAAQPAIEFGANGIQNIINSIASRAKGAVSNATGDAARRIATEALQRNGIMFAQLDAATQKSILADVQEAMKKYGGVNAAALSRQADYKRLGIDPLQPWVTRDPVQFGQYKNLEPIQNAGEPLVRAKNKLIEGLNNNIEGLRGPSMGNQFAAGSVAEQALSKYHKELQDAVTKNYQQFTQLAPNVSADGRRMSSEIFQQLDSEMAGHFLKPELKNTLNDIALGKIPATPTVLYQLQKVANREARAGGNEGYAAGLVSKGIDNELERFSNEYTVVSPEMQQAFDALKAGRAAHRSLKIQEEGIPALKAVAEGKFAPEDFFNRYILGGDVKDVRAMWASVNDPKMKQAARSQLIDYLQNKTQGVDFGYKQLGNILEAPGMPEKIRTILGDAGYERLKMVQRAAQNAIKTPAGTRYNTSGSAAEIMNLIRRSSGVPILGPWITEPLQKLVNQQQAAGMAGTGAAAIKQGLLDPYYSQLLRRSRGVAGLLAPYGAVTATGELSH